MTHQMHRRVTKFIEWLNAKEYACLILIFPSTQATDPKVRAELTSNMFTILGNAPTAKQQIEVLRDAANKIEAQQAEIDAAHLRADLKSKAAQN
jgi:hypothetical protein